MNNENNFSQSSTLRLYPIKVDGKLKYRMVEYRNNRIIREFESESIQHCLDHFRLFSNEDSVLYWMLEDKEPANTIVDPISLN